MTQREAALADKLTRAMKHAARHEGLEPEVIRQGLARGTLVLPANRKHHGLKPVAIGRGARVKINANIGTSPHDVSLEKELSKTPAHSGKLITAYWLLIKHCGSGARKSGWPWERAYS